VTELVLIASPVRMSSPAVFQEMSAAVVAGLTYPDFTRVVWPNVQPAGFGKYWPNAAARNELIDRFLEPEHAYVLWLDIDVIQTPPDLIERLIEESRKHATVAGRAIVAPMVWMERVQDGPVSIENGGWFYDTGGFQDAHGEYANFYRGVDGSGRTAEMRSVGTCYLVPAALYRLGLRYRPTGHEVEHLSFCETARAEGTRVIAVRELNVTHAYLPKYGENWHS
jgi:GT2 family glycosyltransferase